MSTTLDSELKVIFSRVNFDIESYQPLSLFLEWDKGLFRKLLETLRSQRDEPVTALQLYNEKQTKQLERDKAKALSLGIDVESIVKARNDRRSLYNGNGLSSTPKPPTELKPSQVQRNKPIEIKLDYIPEIP